MTKARDLANASTALSAVSATELGYLDGVTSAVQTQIDAKLASSTAATTYQAINTNVSTTELGYLDGVTSAIQTQLDSKAPTSTTVTLTGTQTLTNKTVTSVSETVTTGAGYYTAAVQAENLKNTPSVIYYTGNNTGNWTLNLRGDGATTLNSLMAIGESKTITIALTNGATAYYQTGFQIDGTSQTIKWSGGTAPTAGNANAVDVYSFTIIKTASATYTVFGAGPIKYA